MGPFDFSALAKPESTKPTLSTVGNLCIGTWVILGISIAFTILWIFLWRRRPRRVKRPWWVWVGWGISLLLCIDASLWAAYFLGGGALGWVVPSLAAIGIALYVLWFQQTEQKTVTSNEEAVTAATRPKDASAAHKVAEAGPVIEGGSQTVINQLRYESLTLTDLRQIIHIVSDKLPNLSQVESIVSVSELKSIRFPTGRADASQLWAAVFEAALDEPPERFILLMNNVRDSLGTRPQRALDAALRDLGLY